MPKGPLIAFEGIDGSGKAAQIGRLASALKSMGCDVAVFAYPDLQSRHGRILNDYLKGELELDEKTQLLTFAADIMKDQHEIARLLAKGNVVLLDRYVPSTVAYQCAKGLPLFDAVRLFNMLQPIRPDVIVLIDVPPSVGVARRKKAKGKREKDVHDEDLALQRKVRANYLKLCGMKWLSKNWACIDGRKTIPTIADEIKPLITKLL